jgi:predicted MFS family arabinose efflux permease
MAAMSSVGIMTGLLLGGLVTQELGWRWVFGVMVAPALLAAVAAPFALPEARAEASPRPDVVGAVLVTAGTMLVIFGFTRHENAPLAAGGVLAGAGILALFVAWERRRPEPLIRFGVLATPSLRAATLGVAVNSVAFTAIVFVGTLYLQDELGYRPLEAGLALLPLDLVAFAVSVGAAHVIRRSALPAAFVLTAAALAWLARAPAPSDYAVDLLIPLVVLGISVPVAYVALTNEAVADVAPDEKGLASGIFETANHLIGAAVGVALYAAIIAATGYGTAFAVAAGLALLGLPATRRRRARR